MEIGLRFFCVVAISLWNIAQGFSESGYIITSPSVFRSGVDHVVNVRIFNHDEPVRVNVKLIDLRENMIASMSEEIIGSGSLSLRVPVGREGKASLRVCGNCHLTSGFRFYNSTPVTVVLKGSSAFIQTDKPVYKPSQTVSVNVFIVDRDLRPVNDNVTAYVVAPNDVRIAQWEGLRPMCCGIVSFSFPLSDQPLLGVWRIYAEVQQQSYNSTFEIQKYVLPKFEVGIVAPPYFREDCEQVSVRAYHVFGEPVQGRLKVNMTISGVGYSKTRYFERGQTVERNLTIRGSTSFAVCLNELLPTEVGPFFRGTLLVYAEVTSQDGSRFTAFDDTTPVAFQKRDLEFTEDTRAHFKPGIPFKGKLRALNLDGSGAGNVTIQMNVAVNGEEFFRQHLRSDRSGIVRFTVPALPNSAKVIWLEARVYAINGEPVGAHYLSVYKNLHNWFAPSNCHIMAQGPGEPAMPGRPVTVLVKSSCPCNFTLYYEILARGNIVQTGSKRVLPGDSSPVLSRNRRSAQTAGFGDSPPEIPDVGDEVVNNEACEASLIVDVTPHMAPMSRMLVYYVREDGEGIADSIHLPVEPQLENNVQVEFDSDEYQPGDDVDVTVTSDPGSCACLALVDRSVHIMKPGYMLNREDIFQEVANYDLNNLPYEQGIDWWRITRGRWDDNFLLDMSRDAKHAFLESGLVVMTDVVRLNFKMNAHIFHHLKQAFRAQEVPLDDARNQRNRARRRHRTFFPETWMWKCFNMSSGKENFTLQIPDSITTWQADAVSLNPNTGVALSESENVRSFKKFFVDFNIPYSVVRGEQVRIPLTVYNYLSSCVQVELSVIIPPGVHFNRRHSNRMTRHMCIQPKQTRTTEVILEFKYLGNMNVTASATAVYGVSSCCPNASGRKSTAATDLITRSVLVEPEGIKREYTHSVYFCPNERINITTPSSYTFQFVRLPSNMTGFQFLAKAEKNVHLLLTAEEGATGASYEVVLGGAENTRSWIARKSQHLVTAATNQILSAEEFRHFWITWTGGNIQVGTGRLESPESRFMQWREPQDDPGAPPEYVGFATSEGATGEFRLWKKEDSGGSFSEIFQLILPAGTVSGSERAVASMIGDVMGPTLSNLNNLLRLPFGCGEQNLANFAPNIYVLRYLVATKQITKEVRAEATHYLQTGYQRQLTYKRVDDSYSPFGNKDSSGSMWLTSFVLKSFAQAREFVYIDPDELHDAKEWIISWQQRNGAFPPVGKIWNKDIQAGVDSNVALTAYVTIALLEAGLERDDEEIAVMKAKEFLESGVHRDTDPYTAALTAYALTLLHSDLAQDALVRLTRMARSRNGLTYWSLRDSHTTGDAAFTLGDSIKQTVASAEIEMTSYALLAYTHQNNVTAALPIVKWLSQKRNSIGGFSSTQDTCVALQSLSEYAIYSYIGGVNLDINLASLNLDYERQFQLTNDNSEVLQSAGVPSLPTTMFVEATGDGCALLQIDVTYNIPEPDTRPAFDIKVRHRPMPRDNHAMGGGIIVSRRMDVAFEMECCVRWAHRGSSNMAVMEFDLLSGLSPDMESIERALRENSVNLKRYEVKGKTVLFYFDEIPSTCKTCVRFLAHRDYDVGKAKQQAVTVYDYYEPEFTAEYLYSPSAAMMEGLCENVTSCQANVQAQEAVDDCTHGCANDYDECHCTHECGYDGPPVCGSDGVIYINRCRMDAAGCELGKTLETRDETFCDKPPPTREPIPKTESEEEVDNSYSFYDNFYGFLQDQPFEELVVPELRPIMDK